MHVLYHRKNGYWKHAVKYVPGIASTDFALLPTGTVKVFDGADRPAGGPAVPPDHARGRSGSLVMAALNTLF